MTCCTCRPPSTPPRRRRRCRRGSVRRPGPCTDDQITGFFERSPGAWPTTSVLADPRRQRRRRRRAPRLPVGRRPGSCSRTDARRHGRRTAVVARRAAAARRPFGGIEHEGWSVEARRAPLGVVGFVFEGRPNVFADATGVLRTGNTVVMRIGRDALGTAEAIVDDRAGAGAGRRRAPARRRVARRRRPGGRLGPVRRRRAGPRRGPGLGRGRRPARCRRPPGRHAGQPARHGRRVARRRLGRRRRPASGPRRPLARPQGVQHAQRLLHPRRPRRDLVAVFLDAHRRRRPPARARGRAPRRAVVARRRARRAVRRGGQGAAGRRRARRAGGLADRRRRAGPRSGSGSARPRCRWS